MWLLDLGNSRLKAARALASGLGPVLALPWEGPDLEAGLREALAGDDAPAWWASVAPEARGARVAGVLAEGGRTVRRVSTRAEALGLRIAYEDPSRLGVDRFLSLVAARQAGGAHLLASFGSAITLDLLDASGRHHGGMIGIAPRHAREALAQRFPALDRGNAPWAAGFAADTPQAVAAGVEAQAVGMVAAAWHEARTRLGESPVLGLAGGDAARFAPAIEALVGVAPVLAEHRVLEGLWHLARAEGALSPR